MVLKVAGIWGSLLDYNNFILWASPIHLAMVTLRALFSRFCFTFNFCLFKAIPIQYVAARTDWPHHCHNFAKKKGCVNMIRVPRAWPASPQNLVCMALWCCPFSLFLCCPPDRGTLTTAWLSSQGKVRCCLSFYYYFFFNDRPWFVQN